MTEKRNRFDHALYIQMGACNPSGIAHAIVEACAECRNEGDDVRTDPAIRLMVHQLAYLCNVSEIDDTLMTYSELDKVCRVRSTEFKPRFVGA